MSRSYKKHPICKDGRRSSAKKNRTKANRIVRRRSRNSLHSSAIDYEDVAVLREKRHYQKETDSWEIWDYVVRESEEEARQYYRESKKEYESTHKYPAYYKKFFKNFPDEESYIAHWWKVYYYRK